MNTDNALETYHRKRNFSATPEPRGRRSARTQALQFVVQKHAASHLHYDFRLELDGTLKSWAIPKGPSLDPADKRLAMHVEDHPLDYADFEGIIPPGNYGAGTVIVWDRGNWTPLGNPQADYAKGKLKFELHGEKLRGIWNLVRTHGRDGKTKNAWLLIKERDEAARPAAEFNVVEALPDSVLSGESGRTWTSNRSKAPAPERRRVHTRAARPALALPRNAKPAKLPLTMAPQLATLVDAAPAGKDWIYEVKFDGYRLLARIDGDDIRLFTRAGNDWTGKLRHLATALAQLGMPDGWLDGEIVMLDSGEQPDFQLLQNAFENARTGGILYYLFDMPFYAGHDLRRVPLVDRRALLQQLLTDAARPLLFSTSFEVLPSRLLEHACRMHLEGLIGKRRNSYYQSARSRDWVKLKCLQRQEFVICGYTDPTGPHAPSGFGSLLLGVHDAASGALRFAGRVGTGFTDTSRRELLARMKPLTRETMPFAELTGARPTRKVHWIEPKLVAEVAFSEWTEGGHARHPAFRGLRSDKLAGTITAEQPMPTRNLDAGNGTAQIAGIAISHAERVIDASSGTTKWDLALFYERIAPLLLPHLRGRPVSLVRAPAGVDGQLFFQKHLDTVKIPHLKSLDPALFPGHPPLLEVDSLEALIACAQMNVIEFHTWNAQTRDILHPDRMIFDLDPGEGITWPQIQQAAELTKVMLDELGLTSFLKTSGGKGLHVVVPLAPKADWDTVKSFSQAIVRHLAGTLPNLFVAKSGPRNRIQRIFIDYLRNGYAATTVSAFSVRARAGLGVSVPIDWNDVAALQGSAQWSVRDAAAIAEKSGENPWKNYARTRQTLTRAMARLGYDPSGR